MPRARLRRGPHRWHRARNVLSAANEIAVEAFLADRIPWTGIAEIVEEVLNAGTGAADEVADVLAADLVARERAQALVDRRSTG